MAPCSDIHKIDTWMRRRNNNKTEAVVLLTKNRIQYITLRIGEDRGGIPKNREIRHYVRAKMNVGPDIVGRIMSNVR